MADLKNFDLVEYDFRLNVARKLNILYFENSIIITVKYS